MSDISKLPILLQLVEEGLQQISIPQKPRSLYDPIRYTLQLGGKRMRPQLVIMGAGLVGGKPESAVPAALAVELLHNFTLIHDDIMDDADSRRGKPTVHTKWDDTTAILSGDAMFALAYQQLEIYSVSNGFDAMVLQRLLQKFTKATQIVCEGQALDVEFETSLSVSLDEYIHMIGCKTAALLEASLQMGGIIGGADEEAIKQLGIIGMEAGLAFQIQDDLLDAIGDPEKFGKKQGGDIYEGKKTYLTILALERADTADKHKIEQILQNPSCTEMEVAYVIEMFDSLGVISDTQVAIKNRYISSLCALEHFGNNPFITVIKDLLDKLAYREH